MKKAGQQLLLFAKSEAQPPRVSLRSSWQVLTKSREHWVQWLRLAERDAPECYEMWSDITACLDENQPERACAHLDKASVWCNLCDLPATYNPVLTPKLGLIGMACMGFAKSASCERKGNGT